MLGIYCYVDKQTDNVVYVGKDSNIHENRRHKAHYHKSNRNAQTINKVLQNNPSRYKYKVLKKGDFKDNLLNALEILYIQRYTPKFNYTIGGEGVKGYTHSIEGKQKMRDAKLGRKLSDETKKKMSENNAKYWLGKKRSDETIQKMVEKKKGVPLSDKTKMNMSKSHNSTGFFRVYKQRNRKCKQGFTFVYSYYENGKRYLIRNVNLNKLKELVISRGLDWIIIDEDKANKTMMEVNYV